MHGIARSCDTATDSSAMPVAPSDASRWDLLRQLEKAPIGTREADGSVAVRRGEPAGFLLYGPHWQFSAGVYRLIFHGESGLPRLAAQPVLGVEVIALNRVQQAWRDFTGPELSTGTGWVDFAVPAALARETQNDARFEFRFYHLGNADLCIRGVELIRLPDQEGPSPSRSRWRLLGRLQPTLFARRGGGGEVKVPPLPGGRRILYGGWPYLRLPLGDYRLSVDCRQRGSGRHAGPVLDVEVLGQSRWRSGSGLLLMLRPGAARGVQLVRRRFTCAEMASGPVALDFTVPAELSLDAGIDAPVEIRVSRCSNAALDIRSIDLCRLGDGSARGPTTVFEAAAGRHSLSRRKKIVIIGNCQGDVIREGFNRLETLNSRFDARYYFVGLPDNLYEFAKRDLSECDILLVQDIRNWENFALRGFVPDDVETVYFPAVRFATPWPFDAWNGPGDSTAAREAPNLTFPYHDGLLARLRREIPDREERLRAYRSLEWPGIVNVQRLHTLEERRLLALDSKFGIALGAFILDNFRQRQIFYTTVRPNRDVYGLLMRYLLDRIGVTGGHTLPESLEMVLRNPQIPVHPRVAATFGIRWADENTRYLNRGWEVTWETYVRSYIDHYG